jgi:hypothetical protein
MEIVRVTEAHELAQEDQRFCDATKAWFRGRQRQGEDVATSPTTR